MKWNFFQNFRLALLAAALLSFGAAAADAPAASASAELVRDVTLKKEPFSDAENGAELDEDTKVTIISRQGAWLQVQAGENTGWVRLLTVRGAASTAKSSESGLSKAINVARTGSSGTSVATGVRGLSKEQIQNAQPNVEEVDRMARYSQGEKQARKFAEQKPALAEVQVDYLDESGSGNKGGKP